jgi:hypothetical protein
MVPQTRDVFGITIESYNTAQVAHKQSSPESHGPYMSANVIDNSTGPNHSQNRILNFGFMLSTPNERFRWKTELHPHSLR